MSLSAHGAVMLKCKEKINMCIHTNPTSYIPYMFVPYQPQTSKAPLVVYPGCTIIIMVQLVYTTMLLTLML